MCHWCLRKKNLLPTSKQKLHFPWLFIVGREHPFALSSFTEPPPNFYVRARRGNNSITKLSHIYSSQPREFQVSEKNSNLPNSIAGSISGATMYVPTFDFPSDQMHFRGLLKHEQSVFLQVNVKISNKVRTRNTDHVRLTGSRLPKVQQFIEQKNRTETMLQV